MAPSWLNLSAHLNKSNVGCVPAVASFSLSLTLFFFVSLASCLRLSRTRHLHRPRGFYSSPCPPQGLPPISDSGSSADVFAQYFKRLLMEIAIMPSVLPPSASQFFRKAWFSMAAALRHAFIGHRRILSRYVFSGDVRYSTIDTSIIIKINKLVQFPDVLSPIHSRSISPTIGNIYFRDH